MALEPFEPQRPQVSVDTFQALDLRVGRIERAERFPEARKPAYRLWIDLGPLGIRRSSAQITDLYRPEDLVGRLVVAVVNLPPRQVGPFLSEILVLGVKTDQGVVLLEPDRAVEPGSPIF